MGEAGRDARTTPRWLRVPALLFLAALVAYQGTAYHFALEKTAPAWLMRSPYTFWPATWQMFTFLDKRHSRVEVLAYVDGEWEERDLEALFPYRWESGPRYARSSFRKNRTRMRTLAQASCHRMEPRPEKVRFTVTRWTKTLGSTEQPKKGAKAEPILDWDCEDRVRLPRGKVL